MLKRLFIGLLILSALTAEGAALFNTVLAPLQGQIFNLYGAQNNADEKEAGSQDNEGLQGHVRIKFSVFAPMQEILQKYDGSDKGFSAIYPKPEHYPDQAVYSFIPQIPAAKEADIALNGADASPPSRS